MENTSQIKYKKKKKLKKSWGGLFIKPYVLTGGMKITYGWAESWGSATVTLQTHDCVHYKMTATVWLLMRLKPHYMVDDINWGIFLKWDWDDMQWLYYSLTHNFGCVAKTKALTKSPGSWLPPETGCTQQHRPTNSSSHMHTYSLDGPVLF